jgi:hypothetical protein
MNVDPEVLKDKAAVAIKAGARVEIVGAWVWASFPARPPIESRAALKAAGYHWNKKREVWQYAGVPSRFTTADSDRVKEKYGAVRLA